MTYPKIERVPQTFQIEKELRIEVKHRAIQKDQTLSKLLNQYIREGLEREKA